MDSDGEFSGAPSVRYRVFSVGAEVVIEGGDHVGETVTIPASVVAAWEEPEDLVEEQEAIDRALPGVDDPGFVGDEEEA